MNTEVKNRTSRMLEMQDGAFVYYDDQGSGQPIVMVHGFTCSSKIFCRNVPELSKSFRVITIDLRGHGNSSKVLHGHSIPQYARDVHSVIEYLNLRDVILLGWSMGGAVILECWKQFKHDGRVSQLILEDNSLYPFSPEDWNAHRFKDYNYDLANAEVIEFYTNQVAQPERQPTPIVSSVMTSELLTARNKKDSQIY